MGHEIPRTSDNLNNCTDYAPTAPEKIQKPSSNQHQPAANFAGGRTVSRISPYDNIEERPALKIQKPSSNQHQPVANFAGSSGDRTVPKISYHDNTEPNPPALPEKIKKNPLQKNTAGYRFSDEVPDFLESQPKLKLQQAEPSLGPDHSARPGQNNQLKQIHPTLPTVQPNNPVNPTGTRSSLRLDSSMDEWRQSFVPPLACTANYPGNSVDLQRELEEEKAPEVDVIEISREELKELKELNNPTSFWTKMLKKMWRRKRT